jgi:acetyl-CoA C-acetyltransferase
MLSDELQFQKHLGALFADEVGLMGVEAIQIRAATASGAAALRVGYMSIASGFAETALVLGVEMMSEGSPTPALSKALDAEKEVPDGATLISQNARLMQHYFETYNPPEDALAHFSVNAHKNAKHNPRALFRKRQISTDDVLSSRLISPPIRLLDCSPICDGAAAVVLAPTVDAHKYNDNPVRLVASSVATDRLRISDRINPLALEAAQLSAKKAFAETSLSPADMDLFEVHDAFSIMTCLALEAMGYAGPGQGWRLGAEGKIAIDGDLPICTMGGLKARGHPIGASAIYQVCEIVLQLTGRAGQNQVAGARNALMQSVGGVASTVITHLFSV